MAAAVCWAVALFTIVVIGPRCKHSQNGFVLMGQLAKSHLPSLTATCHALHSQSAQMGLNACHEFQESLQQPDYLSHGDANLMRVLEPQSLCFPWTLYTIVASSLADTACLHFCSDESSRQEQQSNEYLASYLMLRLRMPPLQVCTLLLCILSVP